MNLIVNTDGASRGNPGHASYGYVIKSEDGSLLHQDGKVIGINTNNVAEYTGVLRAFEYIRDNYSESAPHKILLVADSLLIVNQLSGKFKIKNSNLMGYFDKIKSLEDEIGEVTYKQVPRAQNSAADRMANIALDNDK